MPISFLPSDILQLQFGQRPRRVPHGKLWNGSVGYAAELFCGEVVSRHTVRVFGRCRRGTARAQDAPR